MKFFVCGGSCGSLDKHQVELKNLTISRFLNDHGKQKSKSIDIIMYVLIQRRLLLFLSGILCNQPKLCSNATWNTSAITFATSVLVGSNPFGIFVNTNNTIYGANRESGIIRVWQEGSGVPIRNISGNLSLPYSLFVSDDDDIYVDNGQNNYRIDKWPSNSNIVVAAMYTCGVCFGVHIDIENNLYCSMSNRHQVASKSLNTRLNVWNVVAGTGVAGSTSLTLNNPRGVAVHTNLDLFVADYDNHRIQRFRFQELNGTTVAGAAAPGTISLYGPTSVILDADGYVFISDTWNHRIIGSGPGGFRCIVSCLGAGSSSSAIYFPGFISFDSYGNLYVMDYGNHRLQKFLLSGNSCGKILKTIKQIFN